MDLIVAPSSQPWASVGPIPLSAIGVAFYSWVLLLAIPKLARSFNRTSCEKGFDIAQTFKTRCASPVDARRTAACYHYLWRWFLRIPRLYYGSANRRLVQILSDFSLHLRQSFRHYLLLLLDHSETIAICAQAGLVCHRPLWLHQTNQTNFFIRSRIGAQHLIVKSGGTTGLFGLGQMKVAAICRFSYPALEKTLNGWLFQIGRSFCWFWLHNGDLTQILSVGFGWNTIGTVIHTWSIRGSKPRLARLPNSKSLNSQ